MRRRILLASDLRLDLDGLVAPKPVREWIYLDGVGPWEAATHDDVSAGTVPCPVCGGRPLPASRYCSLCDHAGLDGRVAYPGLPVDTQPHPDYPQAPRAYRPGKLKGGVGGVPRKLKGGSGPLRASG